MSNTTIEPKIIMSDVNRNCDFNQRIIPIMWKDRVEAIDVWNQCQNRNVKRVRSPLRNANDIFDEK